MYCSNSKCPDFEATGKHGEYVAGITTCPACGEYLVDTLPPEEPAAREQTHYTEVEPVFETSDTSEALVVKGLLESEGIPYVTSGSQSFDAFRGWVSRKTLQPGRPNHLFHGPNTARRNRSGTSEVSRRGGMMRTSKLFSGASSLQRSSPARPRPSNPCSA